MTAATARLGRTLVRAGVITEDQLEQALGIAEGRPLPVVLDELGFADEQAVAEALAASMGLDFVDLGTVDVNPIAATMVPLDMIRRYSALPYSLDGDELIVALSDPNNIFAVDDIRIVSRRSVRVVVATEADLATSIERFAASQANLDDAVGDLAEIHPQDQAVLRAPLRLGDFFLG